MGKAIIAGRVAVGASRKATPLVTIPTAVRFRSDSQSGKGMDTVGPSARQRPMIDYLPLSQPRVDNSKASFASRKNGGETVSSTPQRLSPDRQAP